MSPSDASPPRLKVAVVTTVHPWDDPRIYHKEFTSLAKAGYGVTLVARADAQPPDARVVPISAAKNRWSRLWTSLARVRRLPAVSDSDIVHIHDPELLPMALALRRRGIRAIYDAHEHLPRQVRSKVWIPAALRPACAWLADRLEMRLARRMSAVVAATPDIESRFSAIGVPTAVVRNYPKLEDFAAVDWSGRESGIVYAGRISADRGALDMVHAMESVAGRLWLAGGFDNQRLRERCRALQGWSKVTELGRLDKASVASLLARCKVGLCLLHPEPNYLTALPTKVFEYMAAGIPVVASNLPQLREIVEDRGAGICVDPLDPAQVARAVNDLLADPERAQRMGQLGRRAAEREFNWSSEEDALLTLYSKL